MYDSYIFIHFKQKLNKKEGYFERTPDSSKNN